MKKLIIVVLFASFAFVANALEIKVATNANYPPFETTNAKGEIIGFDMDIIHAICEEIQANCTFSNQAFDSLIPGLKFKRFDVAIAAIDITKDRAKQVNFTDVYYDSTASYIALKGDMSLEKAQRIGVQNGTTFQQYVVKEAKQFRAIPYDSLQSAILDLHNKRIDMIFGDTAVLSEWMKQHDNLQFVGERVSDKQYFGNGLAIAVNKANQTLLDKLNQGLAAIKANGEYEQIYAKWMSGTHAD